MRGASAEVESADQTRKKREDCKVMDEFLALFRRVYISVSLSVTVYHPVGNVSFEIDGSRCTARVACCYIRWNSLVHFLSITISAHFNI